MSDEFEDEIRERMGDIAETGPQADWKEVDADEVEQPPGWNWVVNPELADHIWTLTADSDHVNYGPDPPVLLEVLTGFFPNRGIQDSINTQYFTRQEGESYSNKDRWNTIGSPFGTPSGDPETTVRVYDRGAPGFYPHRSKIHSQQYTSAGAMFTYEFEQWVAAGVSGFMRVPATRDTIDRLRRRMRRIGAEEFEMQSRQYRSQFATGTPGEGTFLHPHFRFEPSVTVETMKQAFTAAVEYMTETDGSV